MRLKDMSTTQAADALVIIAEPAAEIMEDKNALKMLERMGKMQNASDAEQIGFLLRHAVPLLLRDHRNATFAVISALTGKPIERIAAQSITETISDIKNSVDDDLIGFFTSATGDRKPNE